MVSIKEALARLGVRNIDDKKARMIAIVGVCGILLICLTSVLPRGGAGGTQQKSAARVGTSAGTNPESSGAEDGGGDLDELSRYARELECKAQAILSKVSGAEQVWVTITMEQGTTTDYATNQTNESRTVTEKDASGGTKSTTESKSTAQVVAMRGATDGERTVLVRTTAPKIAGVLVVAQGALDAEVRLELTEAAATLLGVPEHRILVAGTQNGR